jgi:hypothetical protein
MIGHLGSDAVPPWAKATPELRPILAANPILMIQRFIVLLSYGRYRN